MKESVLHIELMDRPVLRVSQSEDGANSSWLDDRTEGFIVINTGTLCKPAKHPSSFVSVQRTISMKLVFENPFAGDHIRLGRARDEIPSVVVQESSIFFFHSPTPMVIGKSVTTRPR